MAITINIHSQNLQKSLRATDQLILNSTLFRSDLILIQEPHTFSTNKINGFPIRFKLFHADSNLIKTAIIQISNKISCSLDSVLSNSNFTIAKIYINNQQIIIVNTYIAPDSLNTEHSSHIEHIFRHYSHLPVILSGDLNARHTRWFDNYTNRHGRIINQLIDELELNILNNGVPTCNTLNGSSIIDLTLTNHRAMNMIHNFYVLDQPTLSDHSLISFNIGYSASINNSSYQTKLFREQNNFDWQIYRNNLNQGDILRLENRLININNTNDIDQCVDTISDIYIDAAYLSLPRIKYVNSEHRNPPWWDGELSEMRKSLNFYRNKFLRQKNQNSRKFFHTLYTSYKHQYTDKIKKKKQDSWKLFLNDSQCKSAYGNTYKLIKQITNPCRYDIPFIDNSLSDSKQQQLDTLLNSLFVDSQETINVFNSPNYNNNELNRSNTFVSIDSLNILLTSLNPKKAPGPDHITNNMIKQADRLIKPLEILFNNCLKFAYFPTRWKKAFVRFIPKPNKLDYSSAKSYRPISLLSCLGKLLEKIIHNLINTNINSNYLYSNKQFGFTRNKSTIDLLDTITKIIIDYKKTFSVSLLGIDIEGAFDNVSWNSVINEMMFLGIPSNLIRLTISFLQNRQVFTYYKGYHSIKLLTKGCPQGSSLSPILWNINLNSLLRTFNIQGAEIFAFADDISIVCHNRSREALTTIIIRVLQFVYDWASINQLKLSYNKTELLNMFRRPLDNITINNINISQPDNIRVLGIQFDKNLKFKCHIDKTICKVNKIKNILTNYCRKTFGLNAHNRVILYKSLIRPALLYGCEVWGKRASKHNIGRLGSIQHQMLLNALAAYRTVSINCACFLTQVVPVHDHIETQISKSEIKRNNVSENNTLIHTFNGLIDPDPQVRLQIAVKQRTDMILARVHSGCNHTLRLFFPSPILPKHLAHSYYTTQFVTGHGFFRSYLNKMRLAETETCECGHNSQTPMHLLSSCTITHHILQQHYTSTLHLYTITQNYHKFISICKQISQLLHN